MSACLLVCFATTGCIGDPANPAATQPTTQVSPETAKQSYWYNQPSVVAVESRDFNKLWNAAQRAMRDAGFKPDRVLPRDGVITSEPLLSKQAFEFWRHDVADVPEVVKSTIATLRRTVRFEVTRRDDGMFELVPKVLVERYSIVEHRVTSAIEFREAFALTQEEAGRKEELLRNPMRPPEEILPPDYWYGVGRDAVMERRLADWVENHLDDKGRIVKPQSPTVLPTTQPSI